MESFAFKWLVVWYLACASILTSKGIIWMLNPGAIIDATLEAIEHKKPPAVVIKMMKYVFLFAVVSIILAFFPFRWLPFIYSFWVVAMVFIIGQFLVKWEQFRIYWNENQSQLDNFYRKAGAFATALGLLTFFLCYQLIQSYSA